MSAPRRPLAIYTDVVDTDIAPGLELLERAGFETRVLHGADEASVLREAQDAEVLLVGYLHITRAIIEGLPKLRLIATQSVGVDMVDTAAAAERGISVATVPGAATEEVAVHALAMALSLIRGLPFLDRDVRAGGWDGTAERLLRPSASTLGVVGMGRIGQRLAALGDGIFGEVVGYDPVLADGQWPTAVRRLEFDALLESSDVVSVHVPLTKQTERLIDAAALARMRPGSFLVNVARGGVVDHDALLASLDRGQLGGAALDVLPVEPPTDQRICGHPRILVTPHAAYLSPESAGDYVRIQAENAVEWLLTREVTAAS
ncbi:C-terminal binding protein [Rhodococcus sp. ABRD24]|uniref:C-terminal binding protein n=1 Tax=Rhodococcus sp. ABRD24 TaxID=2507582 RepID=UPI001038F2BD|nr:C-terminal binding protein [Rhodococcus sp. ABRD24]QBJ96294.1 C-terminal binding protein [Rhodococcus sp. ABRD24]